MKKNLFIMTACLPLLLTGCFVSKKDYDNNINRLANELRNERIEHAATVKALEIKLQERGKSLNELTARYMELVKEKEQSQLVFNGLKGELDVLLRDIAELRLVIFTNVKGMEANEMMIKLIDMQNRVQVLIGRYPNTKITQ